MNFKDRKCGDFVVALVDDDGTRIGYPYKVCAIFRDENGGEGVTVALEDNSGAGLNEGEYTPLVEQT